MRHNQKEVGLSEQGREQRSLSSSDEDALPLPPPPSNCSSEVPDGGNDASLITTSVVAITFSLSNVKPDIRLLYKMRHERAGSRVAAESCQDGWMQGRYSVFTHVLTCLPSNKSHTVVITSYSP